MNTRLHSTIRSAGPPRSATTATTVIFAASVSVSLMLAAAPAHAASTHASGSQCLITLTTYEAQAVGRSGSADKPFSMSRGEAADEARLGDSRREDIERSLTDLEAERSATEEGTSARQRSDALVQWEKHRLAALPGAQTAFVACAEGRNHNVPTRQSMQRTEPSQSPQSPQRTYPPQGAESTQSHEPAPDAQPSVSALLRALAAIVPVLRHFLPAFGP